MNLNFLRNNCWGKKTTQVVCIPLFLGEGQSFIEMWISQQSISTKKPNNSSQKEITQKLNHHFSLLEWDNSFHEINKILK